MTKPRARGKGKPRPKAGRRGPTSDAFAIAEAHALVPDPGEQDWMVAARRALVKIATYVSTKADDGELDPILAISAFRTLAQAVNVREAIVEPPEKPAVDADEKSDGSAAP